MFLAVIPRLPAALKRESRDRTILLRELKFRPVSLESSFSLSRTTSGCLDASKKLKIISANVPNAASSTRFSAEISDRSWLPATSPVECKTVDILLDHKINYLDFETRLIDCESHFQRKRKMVLLENDAVCLDFFIIMLSSKMLTFRDIYVSLTKNYSKDLMLLCVVNIK